MTFSRQRSRFATQKNPVFRLSFLIIALVFMFVMADGAASPSGAAALPAGLMPSSEVQRGMQGYGLSVFKGTAIERFPVVVIGKLKNHIGGSDMILVKVLGGYPVEHKTGVIAGMSGSPVYINGRLIGAIGYGWGFSQEPIGGVTPIESMLRSFPAKQKPGKSAFKPFPKKEYTLSQPLKAGKSIYSRVIINTEERKTGKVPKGTMVLKPMSSLLQVQGFSTSTVRVIKKELEKFGIEVVAAPGGSARSVKGNPAMIKPGAAVGVTLLEGDLSMCGTGTVTYRSGNEILAFGHPMMQMGSANLPLNAAYIEGILPSLSMPFKFASSMGIVGTLLEDRLYAISGRLGQKPPMIPMTIEVSDVGRKWSKRFNLRVASQKYLTLAIMMMAGQEAIASSSTALNDTSAKIHYKIKLKDYPEIDFDDFVAGDDIQFEIGRQVKEYVSLLWCPEFEPPAIEKVSMKVQVYPDDLSAAIRDVSTQYRMVKPGDNIEIAVRLKDRKGETFVKNLKVPVPPDVKKGQILIGVSGGLWTTFHFSRPPF